MLGLAACRTPDPQRPKLCFTPPLPTPTCPQLKRWVRMCGGLSRRAAGNPIFHGSHCVVPPKIYFQLLPADLCLPSYGTGSFVSLETCRLTLLHSGQIFSAIKLNASQLIYMYSAADIYMHMKKDWVCRTKPAQSEAFPKIMYGGSAKKDLQNCFCALVHILIWISYTCFSTSNQKDQQ